MACTLYKTEKTTVIIGTGYKGPERNIYDDPCLTCEHRGIEKICCCKTWEEYWDKHITDLEAEDFG